MSWSGLLLFVSLWASTVQGMAGELNRKQQLAFLSLLAFPDIGMIDAFPLCPETFLNALLASRKVHSVLGFTVSLCPLTVFLELHFPEEK